MNETREFEFEIEEQKRIDFEIFILNEIIKSRKPILGICYGMQLINVFLRGTLYQDIKSQKSGSLEHREGNHIIEVYNNPFIETGRFEVNSSHHQSVKDTGAGIKAFAYAQDYVIEAFYLESHDFLLGVQWHPERMDNVVSKQIFRVFINACHGN
ncbi:MAG: gamma-glutamyl-gamma-aminobutyrate hydrolase family protein [Nitrospirota bacterium]